MNKNRVSIAIHKDTPFMERQINSQNHFDFLFLGMGAANSILLVKLFEAGMLNGKKIGYIDPNSYEKGTYNTDKTFCFWATESELNHMGVARLVSASWENVNINGSLSDIKPYQYYHIRSEDLFKFSSEISERLGVVQICNRVSDIELNEYPYKINCENGDVYTASETFDSRTPKFENCETHQAHLNQSFYGWVVELEHDNLDPETFTMMDFNVPQLESTQFMYVLPFGRNKALVELTRFGERVITKEEADPILFEYIKQNFGSAKKVNEEYGVIPMSSAALPKPYLSRHIVSTGGRAGRIKPSTGYAFKSMVLDSIKLVENAKKGHDWRFHRDDSRDSGRFAFYDRLLLKVLQKEPALGSEIFGRLFNTIKANKVLKFLEEKSTVFGEIPILMSLPKRPFISAAIKDIRSRILLSFKNRFSLWLALVLSVLFFMDFGIIGSSLLGLGLIIVGIPHGAMDHILESRGEKTNFTASFILKYLGLMGLMYVIWQINAPVALILFLGYSAWHFGESDFRELNIEGNWKSFSWGLWLLVSILTLHLTELNEFLPYFDLAKLPEGISFLGFTTVKWAVFFSAFLMVFFTCIYRRYSQLRDVVYIVILGAFMPLLVAFGLYFIGHHSINGWSHLKKGLNMTNNQLWRKAWPFSLGAFFILSLFLGVVDWNKTAYWAQFFIFLSCISFPHVWEMRKFYMNSKPVVS